ncbi:TPA: hypothetical protein I7730_00060 [Vibrio vulnificus]|uniref:Uncharacterized protein n=1 Tax=Vibrio vulnificus TaxID=672 RepID=A0A8H9K5D0_VIBVL|nr:hypothetical protein [Vibrio vulnificus]HAS8538191.1 hypothetical protein [Vibrio vulnificus]
MKPQVFKKAKQTIVVAETPLEAIIEHTNQTRIPQLINGEHRSNLIDMITPHYNIEGAYLCPIIEHQSSLILWKDLDRHAGRKISHMINHPYVDTFETDFTVATPLNDSCYIVTSAQHEPMPLTYFRQRSPSDFGMYLEEIENKLCDKYCVPRGEFNKTIELMSKETIKESELIEIFRGQTPDEKSPPMGALAAAHYILRHFDYRNIIRDINRENEK